ncbi:hypothetical protein ACIGD1_11505 [Streptomyces sp. NPDC085612]|uniref:hypothetical protein n=1 Tax=Streptomyces sp. NPDC085612 TaxID=3365732 RepID=UPI0037D41DFA
MNHQSSPFTPTAGLAAAGAALTAIGAADTNLPTPYVSVHTFQGVTTIAFQLDTPHDFEQWRAALSVPVEAVELTSHAGMDWLFVKVLVQGIELKIRGYGLSVPASTPSAVAA